MVYIYYRKEEIILKHKLIILGGGASGLFAAIAAKDMGIDTAIIEGSDRVGKKLLTTGNGRCNITNKYIEKNRYHSDNPDFFNYCLDSFNACDTENFFNSIGLPLITLEEGKMFPMSLQASSVIDIIRLALEDRAIPLYTNSKIKTIKTTKQGFKLATGDDEVYECEKLILCCGGKSAQNTGSDGSGYTLAKSLGHSLITPIPALVQLKLDYKNLKALSGVKFNGIANILIDGKVQRSEFGEILFTDYGISGPPILQLSRTASRSLSSKNKVTLKINMMYNKTKEELDDFLEAHWAIFSYRSVVDSFIGIINKKIIPILLKEAGISDIHKPCIDLDWKEKKTILRLLTEWEFVVSDTNSFTNAQVTAGGIDTREVDPITMESKLVKNLYFAGEILDVDGDCGGFNLQWAWSSAYAAVKGMI